MKFTQVCATVGALACLGAWIGDATAQRLDPRDRFDRRGSGDEWVRLGCQDVGFRVDRDTIRVGRAEGRFKAIRLRVSGSDVHMLDLKVVYANGEPDDIPVRSLIRAGGQTRPLDLRGRERSISHIEMVYQSRPSFRGQARVCVEGLQDEFRGPGAGPGGPGGPGPGGPGGGGWVNLGCRDVGFRVDRDTIPVGRSEGRFRAIRLRVRGSDVHVMDLRVVYANGDPDDIPVRRLIRAGSQSGPLDLRGRERAIRQIDLIYRSRPGFGGRASVCVEGLD